jgi:tetratricopeptide (TPR) repeat protein
MPEFYDEPKFTVAGVTEAANPGGHGSDTVLRNTETLTRETVLLKRESPATSQPASFSAATERSLREAVEHDPGNAGLHHSLADVEDKLGNPLGAVREYQRAAELDPNEPNLFDWGADLLLHRALEPATEVFAKGNRLFPRSVRILVGLGVSWYARGSYDQAAQRLCEASDLNPDDPNPYLFLGKMLIADAAQSEGSVERLARFARLQPDNALANYYYALGLWKQRTGLEEVSDLAQVESLLQKAVRLDPKLGVGYLQLGILYSDRQDFPKAISAYQEAITADPQLAEAHYRLAQVYMRTGEKLKAQQELQLYDQISKKKEEEVERERREIQQFVYTLRDRTSAAQPQ